MFVYSVDFSGDENREKWSRQQNWTAHVSIDGMGRYYEAFIFNFFVIIVINSDRKSFFIASVLGNSYGNIDQYRLSQIAKRAVGSGPKRLGPFDDF